MEKISFENFIPLYPDIENTENIQEEIGKLKEFNELQLEKVEILNSDDEFYHHQKFLMRYLVAYDKILNIQEAGTGKTGAFIASAKFMKEKIGIKEKIYVLEKSPSTVTDFEMQIKQFYGTDAKSEGYNIMTYGDFARLIKKNYMNEDTGEYFEEYIKKDFNGCRFFIDEAHNLRSEELQRKGYGRMNMEEIYNIIWKVLHIVEGCKIVVGTATPLINDIKEIVKLMNLILPENNQMNENWDYTLTTLKQLEQYFKGKITYVRAMDTKINLIYPGEEKQINYPISYPKKTWNYNNSKTNEYGQSIPDKNDMEDIIVNTVINTYPTYMPIGSLQREEYKKYISENNPNFGFREKNTQYALFIYPNRTRNGRKVIYEDTYVDENEDLEKNEYIKKNENGKYIANSKLKKAIAIDKLENLSCKYAEIVKIEIENKGNSCSFIYNELVEGGGIIVLSLCFEENGFEKYNETENVFTDEKEIIYGKEYPKIKNTFIKKPRYILITTHTLSHSKYFDNILQLLNCPQNVRGEYLQIILGSKILRDGINLKNILRCHIVIPLWNYSGYYQAISRALRQNSHVYILEEQKLLGYNSRIDVVIYNHVSIYQKYFLNNKELTDDEILQLPEDTEFDRIEEDSVDTDIYEIANEKDIKIKRFMRILKQFAVDCELNYKRNYREENKDYSKECDYDICKYECVLGSSGIAKLDYSNYDILYSNDIIKNCSNDIITLLKQNEYITFYMLKFKFIDTNIYKELYVYLAINKLLNNYDQIYDNFGYIKYINTDGYYYYLSSEKIYTNISIYNNLLYGIKHKTFNDILNNIIIVKTDIPNMEQLLEIPIIKYTEDGDNMVLNQDKENIENFNKIQKILSKFSINFLISYVENSIQTLIKKDNKLSEFTDKNINLAYVIYTLYDEYIYNFNEPVDQINKINEYMNQKLQKQGRKATEKTNFKLKNFNYDISNLDKNSKVIINTLQLLNVKDKHGESSKFLNFDIDLRIFKLNDLNWRYLTPAEKPIYKYLIVNHRNLHISEHIKSYNIIGQKYKDTFKLVNLQHKNKNGRDCKTIPFIELIYIFYEEKQNIEEYIPNYNINNIHIAKNDLIIYLNSQKDISKHFKVSEMQLDSLKFLYFLFYNFTRIKLCDILNIYFEETNRILKK